MRKLKALVIGTTIAVTTILALSAVAAVADGRSPQRPDWVNMDGTVNEARAPAEIGVAGPDGRPIVCPNGKPLMVPFGPHSPTVHELVGHDQNDSIIAERKNPDGSIDVEVGEPPPVDWDAVCVEVDRRRKRGAGGGR
jgi:hypothetical protein